MATTPRLQFFHPFGQAAIDEQTMFSIKVKVVGAGNGASGAKREEFHRRILRILCSMSDTMT